MCDGCGLISWQNCPHDNLLFVMNWSPFMSGGPIVYVECIFVPAESLSPSKVQTGKWSIHYSLFTQKEKKGRLLVSTAFSERYWFYAFNA